MRIESVSDLLYYCAQQYPDDVSFVYGNPGSRKAVTYCVLEAEAEKCALKYQEKGFSGYKKIALLGENSYEWILNFFAVEVNGNIAVLLDKAQKADYLKLLAKRMEIDCIVYSDAYEQEAKAIAEFNKVSCFSLMEMITGNVSGIFERKNDLSNHKAVIAFTSGTTGDAKGVVLRHKAIISNTLAGANVFSCHGNTILFLPLHHMYGINTCLLGSMLFGACIYINSSLRYIEQDLSEAQPEFLLLVPMMMESMFNVLKKMHVSGSKVPSKIVSGGAPLNYHMIEKYAEIGISIYNAYGITECAPGIAISDEPVCSDKISMKCITEVKINDPDQYGYGEIMVRGANVMDEYYGQKEETEKAFTDEWFHTGDTGFLEDGDRITINGRIKNLIVLPNGENISPEEIESGLRNLPMIEDVIVKQDGNDLVAEIYPANADSFTMESELKNNVFNYTRHFPSYKRITRVEIRKFPFDKTSTLKIKRWRG